MKESAQQACKYVPTQVLLYFTSNFTSHQLIVSPHNLRQHSTLNEWTKPEQNNSRKTDQSALPQQGVHPSLNSKALFSSRHQRSLQSACHWGALRCSGSPPCDCIILNNVSGILKLPKPKMCLFSVWLHHWSDENTDRTWHVIFRHLLVPECW